MARFPVSPSEMHGVSSLMPRNRPETLSILAAGTRVIGTVVGNGILKIEGTVEGSVQAERQVVVGNTGRVDGDIETHEATIGGSVNGSVVAHVKAIVLSEGILEGTVTAPVLRVDEGARIEGGIQTRRPSTVAPVVTPETVSSTNPADRDPKVAHSRSSRDRSAV